jgi:hypothetical protein
MAVLARRLDFQRLALNEAAAMSAGTVTMVALAAAGVDALAVVLGALTTAC